MFTILQRFRTDTLMIAHEERAPLIRPNRKVNEKDIEAAAGDNFSESISEPTRNATNYSQPSMLSPPAQLGPRLPSRDYLAAEILKQAAALWPVEAEQIASMPIEGMYCIANHDWVKMSSKARLSIALLDKYSRHKIALPAATQEKLLEAFWSEISAGLESASLKDLDASSAWLIEQIFTYTQPANDKGKLLQEIFYPALQRATAAGDLDRFMVLSTLQDRVSAKVA